MASVPADPGGDLEERFTRLMQRLGLAPYADGVYQLLAGLYAESGRHYHTLQHIGDCLRRLDQAKGQLTDPDAAELALWFHDAVYDPAGDDNELRSAFLFDRQLGVHLPTRRADAVHAMIMATVHDGNAAEGDARWVADIDLAGIAAPWEEFLHATELLRRERGHLTDRQFRLGSERFFSNLLACRSIYLTDDFRTRCEAQARRNIEEWIAGGPV